jgi:hypothetical protein
MLGKLPRLLWGRLKLFTANPEWPSPLATAELRSAWTAEGGRPYANLDGAEPRHHTRLATTRAFPSGPVR